MKKNLGVILLGAAGLLAILVLVFMLCPGYVIKLSSNTRSVLSVYECMTHDGGDGSEFGLVLAMIFTIISVVVGFGLAALALLGKELSFAKWLQLGAAVLSLVCVILFFLTATMIKNYIGWNTGSIGFGAIMCAILSLFNVCLFAFEPVKGLLKK